VVDRLTFVPRPLSEILPEIESVIPVAPPKAKVAVFPAPWPRTKAELMVVVPVAVTPIAAVVEPVAVEERVSLVVVWSVLLRVYPPAVNERLLMVMGAETLGAKVWAAVPNIAVSSESGSVAPLQFAAVLKSDPVFCHVLGVLTAWADGANAVTESPRLMATNFVKWPRLMERLFFIGGTREIWLGEAFSRGLLSGWKNCWKDDNKFAKCEGVRLLCYG
jgi:hypothetical protein